MVERLSEWAVRFAEMGLAVFPLVQGKKKPATTHGVKDATKDVGQIKAAWKFNQDMNIGIATGAPSGGLLVIDIDLDNDSGKDGYEYLNQWEREHGELPETVTVITGRGGMHLWYYANGQSFKNSVNEDLAIDIRADGGYVMAPPSIHPNGRTVEFENHPDDYEIAPIDDNVIAFVRSVQKGVVSNIEKGERFEMPDEIGKGGRNQAIFKYCASLQSRGLGDTEIRMLAHAANKAKCKPPMPDDEVDRCVDSALGYDKGNAQAVAIRDGKAVLRTSAKGALLQTCDNATTAIANDPNLAGRFRFDELVGAPVITLPLPWEPDGVGYRPLRDWDYTQLHAYLERVYGLTKKQNVIDGVTNVSMFNRFNPLTDWLSQLTWDGTPRMDTLLTTFLGAEPSDYNAAVMRLMMLGAVARAFEPGTKFDCMAVLVGAQGIGKSTFLRKLACGDDWYLDNLNTIDGDKAFEKIRGVWIAEMAELLATRKTKDVEAIKAFITSTCDTYRQPYDRLTVQRPRTCVFFGTTNSSSFLTDRTGNRRFLPVVCGKVERVMSPFDKKAHEYIEQAWAEAVQTWMNERPSLELPDNIKELAVKQQESFTEDDPRIGIIEDYLEQRLVIGSTLSMVDRRVCTQEILSECLHVEQGSAFYKTLVNDVVQMMDSFDDWERCDKKQKTRNYGVQRCWVPKDCTKVAAWVAVMEGRQPQ